MVTRQWYTCLQDIHNIRDSQVVNTVFFNNFVHISILKTFIPTLNKYLLLLWLVLKSGQIREKFYSFQMNTSIRQYLRYDQSKKKQVQNKICLPIPICCLFFTIIMLWKQMSFKGCKIIIQPLFAFALSFFHVTLRCSRPDMHAIFVSGSHSTNQSIRFPCVFFSSHNYNHSNYICL